MDEEKAIGPRIEEARQQGGGRAVLRECLTIYSDPPAGEESPRTDCEHCDERRVCEIPRARRAGHARGQVQAVADRTGKGAPATVIVAPRAAMASSKALAKK